jgi:mRNA interferase MazF
MMMKRGDIYFAQLSPTVGDETRKKRPVLIVSNNANNKVANTLTVVPLTSNIKKLYPFEVLFKAKESSLKKDSKAQCHQIRTISKQRISAKLAGKINQSMLKEVEAAIKLHLDLHE